MIIALRIVFAIGLLSSLGFSIAYLLTGTRSHIVNAFRLLIVTLGLGLVFFIGMFIERLSA